MGPRTGFHTYILDILQAEGAGPERIPQDVPIVVDGGSLGHAMAEDVGGDEIQWIIGGFYRVYKERLERIIGSLCGNCSSVVVIFDGVTDPDKYENHVGRHGSELDRLEKHAEARYCGKYCPDQVTKGATFGYGRDIVQKLVPRYEDKLRVVSAPGEGDPITAQCAMDSGAAVLTTDGDFFVFPHAGGTFTFKTLSVDDEGKPHAMHVTRDQLGKYLEIEPAALPYLVAMCGNDWVTMDEVRKVREHFHKKYGQRNETLQRSQLVAMVTALQQLGIKDTVDEAISVDPNFQKLLQITLHFYNQTETLKWEHQVSTCQWKISSNPMVSLQQTHVQTYYDAKTSNLFMGIVLHQQYEPPKVYELLPPNQVLPPLGKKILRRHISPDNRYRPFAPTTMVVSRALLYSLIFKSDTPEDKQQVREITRTVAGIKSKDVRSLHFNISPFKDLTLPEILDNKDSLPSDFSTPSLILNILGFCSDQSQSTLLHPDPKDSWITENLHLIVTSILMCNHYQVTKHTLLGLLASVTLFDHALPDFLMDTPPLQNEAVETLCYPHIWAYYYDHCHVIDSAFLQPFHWCKKHHFDGHIWLHMANNADLVVDTLTEHCSSVMENISTIANFAFDHIDLWTGWTPVINDKELTDFNTQIDASEDADWDDMRVRHTLHQGAITTVFDSKKAGWLTTQKGVDVKWNVPFPPVAALENLATGDVVMFKYNGDKAILHSKVNTDGWKQVPNRATPTMYSSPSSSPPPHRTPGGKPQHRHHAAPPTSSSPDDWRQVSRRTAPPHQHHHNSTTPHRLPVASVGQNTDSTLVILPAVVHVQSVDEVEGQTRLQCNVVKGKVNVMWNPHPLTTQDNTLQFNVDIIENPKGGVMGEVWMQFGSFYIYVAECSQGHKSMISAGMQLYSQITPASVAKLHAMKDTNDNRLSAVMKAHYWGVLQELQGLFGM